MADWIVRLDPSAAIANRVMLDINTGPIRVDQKGINWGEAAIKAFMAEQLFGERPSDYRVPNRMVEIPLAVGAEPDGTIEEEEEARQKLQQKVALLQREGGVLMRQREGGKSLYADVVNASLDMPDILGETASIEPNVILKLECLPDFYGDEIELDELSGGGDVIGLLRKGGEPAFIEGDYPARARIVVKDTSGKDQRGLLWATRNYDPSPSAALAYNAVALNFFNGAEEVADAGAYSGKAVKIKGVSEAWQPFMNTTIQGVGAASHLGEYRVWARIRGALPTFMQLVWSNDDTTHPIENEAVELRGSEEWEMVDLGEIRIEEPPIGQHLWRGTLRCYFGGTEVAAAYVDRIWLQPLDAGAGKLRATAPGNTASLVETTRTAIRGESTNVGEGKSWSIPPNFPTTENALVTLAPGVEPNTSKELHIKPFASPTGFGIPEGAIIQGIYILFGYGWVNSGASFGSSMTVRLMKGGTAVGPTRVVAGSNPSVGGQYFSGGATDLWEESWEPADINASNFGISVKATKWLFGENTVQAFVMPIYAVPTIIVYWSFAGEGIERDAVVYATRVTQVRFDGCFREAPEDESFVRVSEETGDLPRLLPSGLEGREVELFLKNSRGILPPLEPNTRVREADPAAKDGMTAKVFYRPCYIGRI